MNAEASILFENNRLIVSGDLNFTNVMDIWNTSLSLLPKCVELHFDFSKVHSSKSAGLALIIEWLKWARRHHKAIKFSNIPQDLMSVANTCGVHQFLSI